MRCTICNGGIHTCSEVCQNCGSLSQSPIQVIKDSVNKHFVNIILGSFGVIIVGIILLSATFDKENLADAKPLAQTTRLTTEN